LLCVALYLAATIVVWPVVEIATDDDFAYAKMAIAFVRTGHLIFNGWETAIVGVQVLWGALFIRLFGYSYLTLRLSTIVLGALLALLLHRVLLRSGVTNSAAVLGTLTVILSPLFLPMATSYMTDVPALLFIVASLYGCQRALRARSHNAALAWLCGSAALNLVDGTVRQIAWLGALVIVPSGFWLLRKRPGFKTAALITWLLSVFTVILVMVWFSRQPYLLTEHIIRGPITGMVLWRILRISVYGPLEVSCFSLPVLAAWIFQLRGLSRSRQLQIVTICTIAAPLLLWAAHYNKFQGRLPPWIPNVVSPYGILWGVPLMGDRPVVLTGPITLLIAVAVLASLAGFLRWLKTNAKGEWFKRDTREPLSRSNELSLCETCVLTLPFSAAYFVLLIPRASFPSTFSNVYDRYYLPLITVAVILLLRLLKEKTHSVPVVCYVTLLLFSFFSIAGTHDLFSAYRATAAARARLVAAGIAPIKISGPWEEDGSNQIDLQGYLNDDRLENPRGTYQWLYHPPLEDCVYWFGPLLPAMHFQYVLTAERQKCLVPSQFPDQTYTTWLPPFQHTIYLERNPSGH
jgi:hypothetical protein